MPIMRCTLPEGGTGYRWGQHGKCYPDQAEAERQAAAAHANGFAGDARPQLRAPRETVLKPVRPNTGLQAALRKKLLSLVDEMANSVEYWLSATYKANQPKIAADESPAAILRRKMRRLARQWQANFDDGAENIARSSAEKAKDYTDKAFQQSLKDAGFTVHFKMTDTMQDAYQAVIGEQVGLIKSIAQQYLTQVETLVMQSVQAGRDLHTLTESLQQQYGVTRRRAELIARDQNNKATATLTRVRQTELGITEAIWMHSHGGKMPRQSHVAADGKRYNISKGMYIDGEWILPGEKINCRCFPRSVIPGITD